MTITRVSEDVSAAFHLRQYEAPLATVSSLRQFKRSTLDLACCAMLSWMGAATAAPLSFTQVPAGTGGMEPAPNVIITVDDSGSMDWDVDTDQSTSNPAKKKMTLLKNALKTQFGDGTSNSGLIPDGRIRLAWQAMHDNGNFIANNGAKNIIPGKKNSMKSFAGTHRVDFNAFVDSLKTGNGTPSLTMMNNVYNYMRTPAGTDSPWANNPGTAQATPYLNCRRTYHVFMTDGAWNAHSDAQRVNKGDSTTQTLGDGTTIYNVTSDQTRVYRDAYGDFGNNTSTAHTLSDFAFRNWATDLQDGTGGTQAMANSIRPLIKQPGVENVWASTPASQSTPCTAANKCTPLQEFWNPKNDPATWQHIIQYTIGFGLGAINWPYAATNRTTPADWTFNNYNAATGTYGGTYGGDYAQLVLGKNVATNQDFSWPDVFAYDTSPDANQQKYRTVELWHAAINGRGKYFPARDAAALTDAFKSIMDTVIGDTSSPLVSIATSSSYLRSGLYAYIAGYNADKYSGSLYARPIDASSGAIGATEAWNAASMLDALTTANLSNRFILSYNGTAGFSWSNYNSLPTAQKTPLTKNSSGTVDHTGPNPTGEYRMAFIRGDRSKELSTSNPSGIFRERASRFGDVVNSNIWYSGKPASGYYENDYASFRGTGVGGMGGRTHMLYVGANDGMLHGIVAANWPNDASVTHAAGKELLAYIPQGIAQGNLRKLTDTSYTHQYFVDGSPFTGDAYIGSTPTWKTVLTGTLAAGGKGYFILDVTNPAQFTVANAVNLVIADTTATTDPDIGHIFSPPVVDDAVANKSRQVVKMSNGRWAVVQGNGYNSTNEAPVLLVQYLDGDKAIKKVSPCNFPTSGACSFKGSNGLSAPQLIDLNGNGTVDVAYAGDLKGNLWKFNLTSAADSDWSVSFGGQPFFVAKPSATLTQSITAAPFWMPHPMGGVMVAVATGQNLTNADQSSTTTESVYALRDDSTFTISSGIVTLTDSTPINTTASTSVPSSLVQQTISATPLVDSGTSYYTSSNNPVDYKGSPAVVGPPAIAAVPPKRGWYLNWVISGQRVLQNIRAFSGQKILVQSTVPKSSGGGTGETCSMSVTQERSFQSVFNMFTGAPAEDPAFSFADAGIFPDNIAKTVTTVESSAGDTALIRTDTQIKLLSSNCPTGQTCNAKNFNPGQFIGARGNFRQLP